MVWPWAVVVASSQLTTLTKKAGLISDLHQSPLPSPYKAILSNQPWIIKLQLGQGWRRMDVDCVASMLPHMHSHSLWSGAGEGEVFG